MEKAEAEERGEEVRVRSKVSRHSGREGKYMLLFILSSDLGWSTHLLVRPC